MKETIRNQWYMVKFCMEASPLHFLYHIVICVGLEIFIFLEHTVWIGYNLDAAEQNRDFSRVLVMTVGMVVLLAFHQLSQNGFRVQAKLLRASRTNNFCKLLQRDGVFS